MDIADRAQDVIEQEMQNKIRRRHTLTLPYSGKCLYCEDEIQEKRFCSTLCRDEWEKEKAQQASRSRIV